MPEKYLLVDADKVKFIYAIFKVISEEKYDDMIQLFGSLGVERVVTETKFLKDYLMFEGIIKEEDDHEEV